MIGGPKEEGGESKGQEDLTSKIKACKNFYYNCKESKSVELGGKAKAISLGPFHSCAILEIGDVKCWGANYQGQLGTGNNTSLNIPSAPIDLGGKAVAISSGNLHSCALLENGQVKCWGENDEGQLGTGNTTSLNIPSAPINLGGKAVAISLGREHSCAVLENGEVKCWGSNTYGQLGIGNNTYILNIPSAAINLGGKAVAISLGIVHSCAILENGELKCWGHNYSGQLGTGNNTQLYIPSAAINLGGKAKAISLGDEHSCAVLENGELKCWGENDEGQLGTGNNTTSLNIPSAAINLGGKAVAISLGEKHSCAVLENGEVKCWGRNIEGQLGTGNTTSLNIPSAAINLGGKAKAISLGFVHSCAVLENGDLKCWGSNSYGQLGYGNTVNTNTPIQSY